MELRVDAKVKPDRLGATLLVGRPEAGEDGVVGVAAVVDLGNVDQTSGQRVDLKNNNRVEFKSQADRINHDKDSIKQAYSSKESMLQQDRLACIIFSKVKSLVR